MPRGSSCRGWYEKSAAEGEAKAMTGLGDLYRDGNGVAKNAKTARSWYEKAVKAGDADAKERLEALPR